MFRRSSKKKQFYYSNPSTSEQYWKARDCLFGWAFGLNGYFRIDQPGEFTKSPFKLTGRRERLPQQASPHSKKRRVNEAGLVADNFLDITRQHHKWVLGALAEIIHNSADANATTLGIVWEETAAVPRVRITDNGDGMTHEGMVSMLMFGRNGENAGVSAP